MNILLVGPDLEDNLSLRYLSATLRAAGHSSRIVGFNRGTDTPRVVEAARGFDAVGLSIAFQARAREFLALADALSDNEVPLVFAGGHYASCAARELLENHPSIDLIVLHEGEKTIVDLAEIGAERSRLHEVAGIVFRADDGGVVRTPRREVLRDLDRLPFPDRSGSVHLFAGVPTAYLMGSRGCVSSCDYCCIVTLHRMAKGPRFRQRRPERIADEMAQLYHERGFRHFIFHDDNFLVPSVEKNHRRLDALERAWRERGLSDIGITLKCRPPDASREILARMKDLGLLRVFLGVESASQQGLCSIGRRQTVAQSEAALETCHELGISAQYTIMTFHPDATVDTVKADCAFLRRHGDHALNVARTEIYAKTPLERRMLREGRAVGDYLARAYRIADRRVERACHVACRLLGERAWAMRGLQDRTIGMDHLSAVVGRFYDDPEVGPLREAIRRWRLRANTDLIDLLEESLSVAVSSDDPAKLRRRIEALRGQERDTRAALLDEGQRLRARLDAFVRARVDLPEKGEAARGHGPRARHAAAVALALTIACSSEGSVSPFQDGGTPKKDATIHHDGIAEAAPPPLLDEDFDGLEDNCETEWFGTLPTTDDSDGDGVKDGDEDDDGNGMTNLQEQQNGGLSFDNQCQLGDGDGLWRTCEETVYGTDPESVDTDANGTADPQEDHDGDGKTNLQEQEIAGEACED